MNIYEIRIRDAAEDLLEALKALLDIAPMARTSGDAEIHRQAEAAIAKAEGQAEKKAEAR